MPANLTPDYLAAEARFRAAETIEDKLAALDEMYATIPKHKGTDKLCADIKRRISKLRAKEKQASKKSKRPDEFHVVKQGAGQVVLLGPPNSGRSTILRQLTSAEPEVADYPFTTRRPTPGMMEFEDVAIQLVDTPAVAVESMERAVISMVRNADAVALVVDASEDAILDQIDEIRDEFVRSRTPLVGAAGPEGDYPAGTIALPTIIVANKIDCPNSAANLDVLREFCGDELRIVQVSARTGEGLEDLRRALYEVLEIVRIYTKIPGKPPDMHKPFTLKRGSTLLDFAGAVHKDFVHSLRFAKAWGKGMPNGIQIGRDHVLEDGDVVELHA